MKDMNELQDGQNQQDRDRLQDEMIQSNAEHIQRNEEAIRRQTIALEQIRDHYFPKSTLFRSACSFVFKVVGVVAVYAGLMEAAGWYFDTRKTDSMARQSAEAARRLFFRESDMTGAVKFLEKAVELDESKVRYRIRLAYIKGISAIADLFDIGRDLTVEERERVDNILSEARFLQEVEPDDPMPHVLAAQVLLVRGERDSAIKSIDHATSLDPDCLFARINSCAIRFFIGDFPFAKAQIAEAERIDPAFPIVYYWKGMLALRADHDLAAAQAAFDRIVQIAPNHAIGHAMTGMILMAGKNPNLAAARSAFQRALTIMPKLNMAMLGISETYERENNPTLAKLWLNRILDRDPNFMKALLARARLNMKLNDPASALTDLSAAVALAPFRADIYRLRAEAYAASGETAAAESDRNTAEAIEPKR